MVDLRPTKPAETTPAVAVAAAGVAEFEAADIIAKPFLRWAGGKTRLLRHLVPYFPDEYNAFYEPFLGGGAVFFAVGIRAGRHHVLSDLNDELINTWTIVRDEPLALVHALESYEGKNDEASYYEVRDGPAPSSQLERAARFVYLNQTAWNGLWRFVDGPQGLVFRDLEDGGRDFDKPADFETGTNGKCRNQWHMRWWEDDAPHSTKTNHGSEHQWAIATIHREKYIGVQKGGHSLVNVGGGYWDSYRQVAINRHRGRCRLSRWRMYPGGRRPYQGKDHDGYLGLVEFRQAPGPGNGDNRRCFLDR